MRYVSKRIVLFLSLLAAVTCVLIIGGCSKGGKMTETNEISPIIDQEGADPYVLKHGGWYYYTKTTGTNVTLQRSKSFTAISTGEQKVLYEPPFELVDLWAPEIFYLDHAWYVYFAARVPGEEMHFMYVLVNHKKDPFEGEWECMPVKGMDDKFAIDGTILGLPSGRYFVWSGWEGYENVRQNIYLAEMISPTEVAEEKILLSTPEYDWEMQGEPFINEGPAVLIQGETVNLVYSASGSWTDDYCLGLLTTNINSDVKSADSWEKKESPVMSKQNGVFGPGHNCFTVSPDGNETMIVYHAARWQGAGWSRSVRYGYVTFDDAGKILDMEPAASDDKLKIPSGGKARNVYSGEDCPIGRDIMVEQTGSLDIYIYAKVNEFVDDQNLVWMELIVNDQTYRAPVYPSDDFQPVSFHVELQNKNNKMAVFSESGSEDFIIDRIEIE